METSCRSDGNKQDNGNSKCKTITAEVEGIASHPIRANAARRGWGTQHLGNYRLREGKRGRV
jgi:hypothetical protein